ncbi:hypothetical protein [Solirubrum puertoriconensis]|uniref:Uncharacterized protein n=1 Tax=Solirubrum puertoriconensis TaxID=1751427 RepID=A0A9X0HNB9_SOLP1|nr:hypothetical protein [Solirubrum puertoriconensis]KUG09090.1 hypothetical protein ASU33_19925 [Solirubrum puertoriconensis]
MKQLTCLRLLLASCRRRATFTALEALVLLAFLLGRLSAWQQPLHAARPRLSSTPAYPRPSHG